LLELCSGLFEGSTLQAEPLAMRRKALSFLRQVLRGSLTQDTQYLSLGWGVREEFPCALALQRALGEALLARGPQQAAPRITEATFEVVVCPR
jgi:hypothetical protein